MASKTAPSNTRSQSRITCLCSPTKHPGSFKCSRHRNANEPSSPVRRTTTVHASSKNLALIAKANSNKAFPIRVVKPSRSNVDIVQRRRNFQPKPSRFSLLNGNRNGFGVSVS